MTTSHKRIGDNVIITFWQRVLMDRTYNLNSMRVVLPILSSWLGVKQRRKILIDFNREDTCMHNKCSCSLGVFLSIFRFAAQPAIRNQGLPARFNRSRVAQISPLSKSKPSASQTTPAHTTGPAATASDSIHTLLITGF